MSISSIGSESWAFDAEDERLIQENPLSKELVTTIMKHGKNIYHQSALYNAVAHKDLRACTILCKAGAAITSDIESLAAKVNSLDLNKILFETNYSQTPENYQFTIRKKDYLFQTNFELDFSTLPPCDIVKNKISITTCYQLESERGYEGYARARLASLGSIYAWAKDLDLYDANEQYLGMIDGEMLTTAEAKFSFYDYDGVKLAIAYLDQDKTGFTLVHPDKPGRVIARMQRQYVLNTPDFWEIKVYHGKDLDIRFIKSFAAFAVDSQDLFKKDL